MDKRKLIIGIISGLLALFFILAFSINSYRSSSFITEKVQRGDVSYRISATGTLSALITVQVGTQVSGTIKEIYVDFNSRVKKGQILALIDPDAFVAQLNQAEANLENARANLKRAEGSLLYSKALLEKSEAQLKEAEANFKRMSELFREGIISMSQFDSAKASYEVAIAQRNAQQAQFDADNQSLKAALAQVRQWEQAVNLAKVNLERTRIRSPIDGIVISRNVDAGQTVAATLQSPTLFVIANDLKKMRLIANVSEADIGIVRTGQTAIFTVDAYPEKNFNGSVDEIRLSPNVVQNVVTYEVLINVDNEELLLKPGMTATVYIYAIKKENVLRIPNTALIFRPKDLKENPQTLEGTVVWILKNGKTPVPVTIKTGISDDMYTEVISGDIREGNDVVVAEGKKPKDRNQGTRPRIRFIF